MTEFGAMTKMTDLQVEDNIFVGTIPTELGNLKELVSLRLNDMDLAGMSHPSVTCCIDSLGCFLVTYILQLCVITL